MFSLIWTLRCAHNNSLFYLISPYDLWLRYGVIVREYVPDFDVKPVYRIVLASSSDYAKSPSTPIHTRVSTDSCPPRSKVRRRVLLTEEGTTMTFGRWFALRTIVLDRARPFYVTVFRASRRCFSFAANSMQFLQCIWMAQLCSLRHSCTLQKLTNTYSTISIFVIRAMVSKYKKNNEEN